ncbi:nucleoside transporter-domain-containing protein [Amanita rubescens]|nr:nucleoside transporter-domain-containing protein [Amanita rubescens]
MHIRDYIFLPVAMSSSTPLDDNSDPARAKRRSINNSYYDRWQGPSRRRDDSDALDPRIRWIHFMLGCTVLVPSNVTVTAIPFFLYRLAGSPFTRNLSSYISVASGASQFICLAHAMSISKQTSLSRQIRWAIRSLLILTVLLTMSTFLPTTPGFFFYFVIAVTILATGIASYLQSSVSAVAALFGPEAMQAMMSGQAAIAVAMSTVQVISILASESFSDAEHSNKTSHDRTAEERSACAFFALSACFLAASAFAHRTLTRMHEYRILVAPMESGTMRERQALLMFGQETVKDQIHQILSVAKANIIYEIAVAYVGVVTLAIYPAVTASIMPYTPGFQAFLFTAIHFLVFNVGDLLGRYLCSFPSFLVSSSSILLALSLGRTLFVPIFSACNINRQNTLHPGFVNSDTFFFFLLLAFGVSNGYVSSLCLMFAPSLEHNKRLRGRDDIDIAAMIAVFFFVGGLAVGSFSSFGLWAIICRCNPFWH